MGGLDRCYCERTCSMKGLVYREEESWTDGCRNCTCTVGYLSCVLPVLCVTCAVGYLYLRSPVLCVTCTVGYLCCGLPVLLVTCAVWYLYSRLPVL